MSEHDVDRCRRRVLKGAAAGAIGVTIWAEPTIRGLARRPAYAQAGSGSVQDTFARGRYTRQPVVSVGGLIELSIQPGPGSSKWQVEVDIADNNSDDVCTFDVSNIEIILEKGNETGSVFTVADQDFTTFVELSGRPTIVDIKADIAVTCQAP